MVTVQELKAVLSLDDSDFTNKIDIAAKTTDTLRFALDDAEKNLKKFEEVYVRVAAVDSNVKLEVDMNLLARSVEAGLTLVDFKKFASDLSEVFKNTVSFLNASLSAESFRKISADLLSVTFLVNITPSADSIKFIQAFFDNSAYDINLIPSAASWLQIQAEFDAQVFNIHLIPDEKELRQSIETIIENMKVMTVRLHMNKKEFEDDLNKYLQNRDPSKLSTLRLNLDKEHLIQQIGELIGRPEEEPSKKKGGRGKKGDDSSGMAPEENLLSKIGDLVDTVKAQTKLLTEIRDKPTGGLFG